MSCSVMNLFSPIDGAIKGTNSGFALNGRFIGRGRFSDFAQDITRTRRRERGERGESGSLLHGNEVTQGYK